MLVLTRLPGQSLIIGDSIEVVVTKVNGAAVGIGIDAPSELVIFRKERRAEWTESGLVVPGRTMAEVLTAGERMEMQGGDLAAYERMVQHDRSLATVRP
jgi:carbon storage regulator CsrA